MNFHFSRSLASTNISAVLLPSQAAIPSCVFILWRPLLHFPSIFPVVNKCSSFPFLITWPRNSACLLLTLLIRFLVLPAVFRISKLVRFSVHDTLSIFLKNHISIASMDVNVCLPIYPMLNQCQWPIILASDWSRAIKLVMNIDENIFRMPIYLMLNTTFTYFLILPNYPD